MMDDDDDDDDDFNPLGSLYGVPGQVLLLCRHVICYGLKGLYLLRITRHE